MNKKFSTLLMGGLLVASAAVAQAPAQPQALERVTAEVATAPSPKLYYQIATAKAGYALQATTLANGEDGLVAVNLATLEQNLNGDLEASLAAMEALDATLWAFTPNGASNAGYYTIVNKATGKKLQLTSGDVVLDAWQLTPGTTFTLTSSHVKADNTKTNYALTGVANGAEVKAEVDGTPVALKLVLPGHIYMNAAQLNAMGDGSSFKMAIEGLADANNPFVKTALKATDVTPSATDGVTLQVVGAKVNKKDAFVAVDTLMYTDKGGVDLNGTDAFGYKFVADNAKAAGRKDVNYHFAIYKDVTKVGTEEELMIKLLGVPTYTKGAKPSEFAADSKVSYVSWAGFADKGDELTTARISVTGEYAHKLPVITLAAGSKADITPGVYYLKLKEGYAYDNMVINAVNGLRGYTGDKEVATGMNNDLLARTQYVVSGEKGKYTIVNRESNEERINGRVYVNKAGKFVCGATEFELEAVPAAVAADNHVGFKFFSKEEVANMAVALKFNSKLGSAYMVEAKNNVVDVDAKAELEGASFFKVKPVETVAFGQNMEFAVYKLYKQFTNKYLHVGGSLNDKSVDATLGAEAGAATVLFRSTGEPGKYQIVFASENDGDQLWDQLSVLATEAKFNKLAVDDRVKLNGHWTLETPAAPDYLTLDAPGYKRIFSSENTSLSISMSAKKAGILKGLADTDANYIADQFAMFVDTACVENADKPLYYITTQMSLDSAKRANGYKMYMMPGDFKQLNDTYTAQVAPVKFVDGYTVGQDTLAISTYNEKGKFVKMKEYKEMAKNPAAFAFQMTPVAGEYIVENLGETPSYLRQVNGVLYLTQDIKDALAFGIEAAKAPVANENVAVSEVAVIAGEGQLTIANAAGKRVVVSNILGQVVANTVLSSDNATIAAPQGVVVVAVEGEEAVKAIVK